jgi:TonB family protein
VAYELLTTRAPFPGKSITEVVARVVHGSHIPPREVDARFPEALNEVFVKAFAPRPERRYNQAVDFARDLQGAVGPILELEISHRSDENSPTRIESQATTVKGPVPPSPVTTVRGPLPSPPVAPPPLASPTAVTGVFPGAGAVHREGVLILDSDPPGASVFLDSKPVGTAPLESLDAGFGRHLVRMELPGREAVSTTIELRPERPLKVVTFTLPLPGPGSGVVRPGQLVAFGPEVQPPARISGPLPGYPETARERGLEGTPVVELWVSETGEVFNTAVVESAGDLLDRALLAAVTRWRFAPATLRGVPVSVRITVQHHFRR